MLNMLHNDKEYAFLQTNLIHGVPKPQSCFSLITDSLINLELIFSSRKFDMPYCSTFTFFIQDNN